MFMFNDKVVSHQQHTGCVSMCVRACWWGSPVCFSLLPSCGQLLLLQAEFKYKITNLPPQGVTGFIEVKLTCLKFRFQKQTFSRWRIKASGTVLCCRILFCYLQENTSSSQHKVTFAHFYANNADLCTISMIKRRRFLHVHDENP